MQNTNLPAAEIAPVDADRLNIFVRLILKDHKSPIYKISFSAGDQKEDAIIEEFIFTHSRSEDARVVQSAAKRVFGKHLSPVFVRVEYHDRHVKEGKY